MASKTEDSRTSLLHSDSDSDVELDALINDEYREPVGFKEKAKVELNDMKEAVFEAMNRFTLISCGVVVMSSYVSLVGWGPYIGPYLGPWLHSKGLPGGGEWVPGVYGGHRTKYTIEGEKRNHEYMKDFAEKVRVVPSISELDSLKVDLKHLRSSIGYIVDEIHEDGIDGQYKKNTYMKSKFEEKWNGAAEFYSPNPRVIESNLTIGMFTNSHILHGHGHMKLPNDWYECLHVGITSWDMIEITKQIRRKNSLVDVGDQVELENVLADLEALQASYRAKDILLKQAIDGLFPKPSDIIPWFGIHNRTGFMLDGYALKYCPSDLKQQGSLAKGPGREIYEYALDSVAKLSRKLKLSPGVLMLWYGHKWGDELGEADPYKHMNVLQEIYPVITGLQTMRFSGVAHRTNAPIPPMNPITRIPTYKTNIPVD